jgi:uncharacterized protein (DUF58 family)
MVRDMSRLGRYLDPLLVESLRNLQLPARRLAEGGASGRHKSPRHGASVEFRQHRFYTAGDEVRHIDWRLLARTDRPFVRQFEQETNLRCMIALDASGSMGYRGKFDYSLRLATALAYLLLGNGEHVGLSVFTGAIDRWISPLSSTQQLARLVDAMERTVPRGNSEVKSLHDICQRLRRRSLVIVVSDLFFSADQIATALARLRHNRHETILARILHPDEIEFPFKSWTQLEGLEGERPQAADPALGRRIYLQNFARHDRSLHDICRAQHVELATFRTDEPLSESLGGFLRKRLLMKH